jgi:iron complex transport system substrate-binding protein
MLFRHDATGQRETGGWEGGGGGSPESEDLPVSDIPKPSRKGEGDEQVSRRLALAAILLIVALVPVGGALSSPQATAAFPVTITTPDGKVTITKRPTRVVSLSASATESLFAIGAGSQVIAVDNQSDYPKNTPKTSLSGFTPNVEAIAAYKPDLVVISYDTKGLSGALQQLGIPVIHHDAPKNLRGAYQQIAQLGKATGQEAGAQKTVAAMKLKIGRILKVSKPRAAGLTVYHELTPDLYSATSRTFIGLVYAQFGLKNVADAADKDGFGYPQLSSEYVVKESPDLIVLADSVCCGQTTGKVGGRPGWSSISAVKTGSIVRVDDSIASRWGPRLVNFYRAVATALKRLKP